MHALGGNPANALPDQHMAVAAMQALELLVSIDPVMSHTAQLADYMLPPKVLYEKADLWGLSSEATRPAPFGQYTPEIVKPPEGAQVVDDWYVFWALAKRLGQTITLAGVALDFERAPTTDELLEILARDGAVALSEIKKYPGGKIFDVAPGYVEPPLPGAAGKFDVCPEIP